MLGHKPQPTALVGDPDLFAIEGLIDEVEEFLPELGDGDVHDCRL